jgi:2-dehydropantoate 2-reductase
MGIRYAVIGTGALGGYYGGKLAKAGKDVHFLFRSDFEHVRKNGLHVDSVNGDFWLKEINAYGQADDLPVCDVILVCMKTTGNHHLPELLKSVLHPKSVVVMLQNGLGVEEDLSAQIPEVAIAGGLAFICSNKIRPGHIQHLDLGKLILGSFKDTNPEILNMVVNDFLEAGIPSELASDLNLARWQKLAWNIPFSGMTVVLNTDTDQLMSNESTRILCREIILEVIGAADACGAHFSESLADKMIAMTRTMKPYAPSMKLDFDFRRPMEIEYIYSKPIQIAREAGFEMKKVGMLEKQLKFIQEQW